MSALPSRFESSARGPRVRLLRADSAFREAIPDEHHRFADRFVTAAGYQLAAGPWLPERLGFGELRHPVAVLLLEGVLVQEVLLGGRASAELIGPGEMFRPWKAGESSLPCSMRWQVTGKGALIAALDEQFVTAARKWPELQRVVSDRFAEQLDAATRRAAIVALPRVEQRVLALFWQLADRFGTVGPNGVIVHLDLTHDLIGRLVAAKRPTVSLALGALGATDDLVRLGPGEWRLRSDSQRSLGWDWAPPALMPVA